MVQENNEPIIEVQNEFVTPDDEPKPKVKLVVKKIKKPISNEEYK